MDADVIVWKAERKFLVARDTSGLVSLVRKLVSTPAQARRCCQSLLFLFGEYDNDPREVYVVPEIQAWLRKLDADLPYVLYFVHPSQYYLYIASQEHTMLGNSLTLPGVLLYVSTHQAALDDLAARIGDDRERIAQVIGDGLREMMGQHL